MNYLRRNMIGIAPLDFFLPICARCAGKSSKTFIALIGGVKSPGPGQHDFPNGICALKALLNRRQTSRIKPMSA